jgi:zinc finger protein
VLLSSFECPHCGWKNSEVQEAAEISETGILYEFEVTCPEDLQRTVVLSAYAGLRLPEIELEAPASGRGRFTTIEGVLVQAAEDLRNYVEGCDKLSKDETEKLRELVAKLERYVSEGKGFHLVVEDPAGNSYVDILDADGKPSKFGCMKRFRRTHDMNVRLGIAVDQNSTTDNSTPDDDVTTLNEQSSSEYAMRGAGTESRFAQREVLRISSECPSCGKLGENRIHETVIPHFQDILLIAFTCDHCGFKSSEVKPSGHCAEKGRRITLHVQSRRDFSRDLIKSDTARLVIPQVGLELEPGTLGSKFTTVEGIVRDARDALSELHRFVQSDDYKPEEIHRQQERFTEFLRQLDALLESPTPAFDLILDDPLGNSYIQSPEGPDVDPQLQIEEYERSAEMNEALGIVPPTETNTS